MTAETKEIAVVKIDSELLRKVEEVIKEGNNKFSYATKKQFVDLAVYEKLKKEGIDAIKKKS
jgi:hypothetical protein